MAEMNATGNVDVPSAPTWRWNQLSPQLVTKSELVLSSSFTLKPFGRAFGLGSNSLQRRKASNEPKPSSIKE